MARPKYDMPDNKIKRQENRVYHERYNAKRRNKSVSFRTDSALEVQLLAYADSLPNFGEWVKTKLRAEIK